MKNEHSLYRMKKHKWSIIGLSVCLNVSLSVCLSVSSERCQQEIDFALEGKDKVAFGDKQKMPYVQVYNFYNH